MDRSVFFLEDSTPGIKKISEHIKRLPVISAHGAKKTAEITAVPISNNESACNKKITTARIQYCHWSLRFV
jgi:hypothetical protein